MWRLVHRMTVIGVVTLSLTGFGELAAGSQDRQTVTLQIDGMTCGGCVKDIKAALTKVPGVSEVEFSTGKKWVVFPEYSNARASVTFDPKETSLEALIKDVEAANNPFSKYRAEVFDK